MNAITKRLLSFVIVLAMVLSMTPVITFSADAAADPMDAVEAWHTAADGALKFAGQTGAVTATCPVCDKEVTWNPLAASPTAGHYYIAADIDTNSKQYMSTSSSNADSERICIYLNDNSLSVGGWLRIRCQLNVIAGPSTAEGDNQIVRKETTNTDYVKGLLYPANLYATLQLFGGTYKNENPTTPVLIQSDDNADVIAYDAKFESVTGLYATAPHTSRGSNNTLTANNCTMTGDVSLAYDGDKFTMNGGSLAGAVETAAGTTAAVTLSGAPTITGTGLKLNGTLANIDGLTSGANIAVTGVLGDKLTAASSNAANVEDCFTVNGETELDVKANTDNQLQIVEYVAPFVPPETCPCCGVAGSEIEWTAISEATAPKASSHSSFYLAGSSAVKAHCYLAKDVTVATDAAYGFLQAYGAQCALYLNGKTLTYNGAKDVFTIAANTLTIYGEGKVINNTGLNMFDFNGAGRVNILGGEFVQNSTNDGMFEDLIVVSPQTTHALISGGTFNVNPAELTFSNANVVTIADGYEVTDNGDGTYTVQEIVEQAVVCPGCGLEVLPSDWEEYTNQHLTAETALTEGTKHYKLTANLTCGPYGLYMTGGTVCFDLNGYNINRSGAGAAFRMSAGTLNVFGEGVVTGSQYGTVRLDSSAATANLRGGTYTKYTTASGGYRTSSILSLEGGGTVNMYDGVTLTTAGKYNNGYGAAVALGGKSNSKSVFNMYGGTITFGDDVQNIQSAGTMGGLITVGRSVLSCWAEATITGGTINAVALENVLGDAIYVAPDANCFLTIGGDAEINGEVWAGIDDGETVSTANINLADTPTITNGLVLNGAQVNIDALAAGASIDVNGAAAGDVLTAESANAATVIGCFTLVGAEGLTIKAENDQLVVAALVQLPTVCPYCGELTDVEWIALGTPTGEYKITAGGHYYLATDFESGTNGRTIYVDDGDTSASNRIVVCLYLNGNDITNTRTNAEGTVINARYDIVNIWGEGTVSNSGGTGNLFGYGGSGEINIYGGNYVHNGTGNMFGTGGWSNLGNNTYLNTHCNIYGGTFNADLSKVRIPDGSRFMATPWNVSVVNGNTETVYADAADAVAAYNGGYIRVNQDAALNLTGAEYYIDNAGNRATVTGTGTLYAMNSSGDDYATTSDLFLVGDEVTVVRDVTGGSNGYRYIVTDGGSLDGLRIVKPYRLEMKLSAVTLRPALNQNMGLYYKASISCGPELASLLGAEGNAYGVVLSLQDMPGTDFATEINEENGANRNAFTEIEGQVLDVNAENNWTVVLNSGSVFNIMKADSEKAAANKISGELPIYANAYLSIKFTDTDDYEYFMADTVNGGTKNGVQYSLYDVLHAINQKWDSYADYHESLNNFYTYWYDFGMSAWESALTNFKKNG